MTTTAGGAMAGGEWGGVITGGGVQAALEGGVELRTEAASACCSISVQIPTISVIMLRMASAVLLSPSGSVKKVPA